MLSKETTLALLRDQFGRVAAAHAGRTSAKQPEHALLWHREDGGLSITHPSQEMVHYLMLGGVVRDMRQIGSWDDKGTPQMEGTGRLLAPMTYEQAIEYIAWRDVPANVLSIKIVHRDDLPSDRLYRNAWRMKGSNYGRPA